MTETNENMLLRALARKNLGNSKFFKKYGLPYSETPDKVLAPYAEKNEQPPSQLLDRLNMGFEQEFLFAVKYELAKGDVSQEFIDDLVTGINS